ISVRSAKSTHSDIIAAAELYRADIASHSLERGRKTWRAHNDAAGLRLTLHRSKCPETRSTEVSNHVILSAFVALFRADLMAECEANSTRVDLRAPSDASTRPSAGTLLLVLGVIAVIWLIAASRWIVTDTVVPWDSKNQFYAFFRFLAASIHS